MTEQKTIRINHVEAVENYLGEEGLVYIDLERNAGIVKGGKRLANMLPKSFEPKDIEMFYKRTGLKVQIHVMKDYDWAIYDRKGKYPRDDAYVWNENFMKNFDKHPEWLEPQEEADIFIIYKFNPVEIRVDDEDMEIINPIKRQKYHVWDGTKKTLPAKPEVKYVRDFDDLIDRLEYATDTIFDLLWLYNISGLIVEKVVKYQDPESNSGIRVAFTIFGTYVKENDTDEYFPEAETGSYNLGNSSDWNSETDLSMWMEETRPMKYLKKDVRKFYDTTGLNLD